MYERQWVKCKRKRNLKNIKSSFWLPIWFVWTNILVHPLANKSWWLKGIIFWNTIFLDCVCPNTPPYKVSHHPSVFLGQIWSQKLKFSKLTKIWYRGTLLYPYFKFNVYYFQNVCHSHFLGKFGHKNWSSLQINWNLVQK